MLEEIRSRIEDEITSLTHELNVELPARIKTAMEHGDLRENAEFKAAKERQAFVEARLNHLTSRMTELSKIFRRRWNLTKPARNCGHVVDWPGNSLVINPGP